MSSQLVGVMPAPDGITPNFSGGIGSTHLQRTFIIVFAVTFGLATITLCLRAYTSTFIVKKFGWDSPIIVAAWGVALAFFIASVLAMASGFGDHLWNVTPQKLQGYLDLLLVLAITYLWPPTLTKLAILELYYRLFPNKIFRYFLLLTAVSIFGYTVVFTALFAGPCNPQSTGSGVCLNNIALAHAVLNIVSDGVIIILPIPIIHHLNMHLKQRITIGLLLALGSGVIIASIVRVGYVRTMQNNPDVTWTQASAAVWSLVELNIGIVCNCLATLRPFIRRHLPRLNSLINGTRSTNKYSNQPNSTDRFKAWRGDKAAHGYELHSVDRGLKPGQHKPKNNSRGIAVVDEYQVQYENRGENGDASSTEIILSGTQTLPGRGKNHQNAASVLP